MMELYSFFLYTQRCLTSSWVYGTLGRMGQHGIAWDALGCADLVRNLELGAEIPVTKCGVYSGATWGF